MKTYDLEGLYTTAEEYARDQGKSVATIKRWCARVSTRDDGVGRPKVTRIGRQWLIRVAK